MVNSGLEVRLEAERQPSGGGGACWSTALRRASAPGARDGLVMDNLVFPMSDFSSLSLYQPARGGVSLQQGALGGWADLASQAGACGESRGEGDWKEADVVFVHGIDGTGLRSWRAVPTPLPMLQRASSPACEEPLARLRGAMAVTHGGLPPHLINVAADDSKKRGLWPISWLAPRLLLERQIAARIVSIEYDARPYAGLTARTDLCIEKTAAAVGRSLRRAKIGANGRPVLFVCHSMGGLVVKAMLRQRAGLSGPADEAAAGNPIRTEGAEAGWLTGDVSVMFLATPHRGSQVSEFAKELETAGLVRVSPVLKLMKPAHPYLLDLNEDFIDLATSPPVVDGVPSIRIRRVRSFAEGKEFWLPAPASSVAIVLPESADPGIGSFEIVPEADHLSINKPSGPNARLLSDVAAMVG
jgi:hypothetical protein